MGKEGDACPGPGGVVWGINWRDEFSGLISQFVTSKRGGTRKVPYVFTEQGIAMLSTVLKSERALQVNIAIMRAFVKLRELLLTHNELAQKIDELERKYDMHEADIQVIFQAIKKLLEPPEDPPRPRFGMN
ncbi:MAG TPA: ORF6N domain-containing protein [Candidatus Omnitrophota bacterium]|nr:ORF6N domain-containing protein [Candidatus Omnitrophota bacterium]